MPASPLGPALIELAQSVLNELNGRDAPLDQRIEALKVVGTLHLGLSKLDKGDDGDDKNAGLPAMRERLRMAAGGK